MGDWLLDEISALTGQDARNRDTNRRLAGTFTETIRKALRNNNLVVKIPWSENDPPRIGETWEVAEIIACGEPPIPAGTVRFRITPQKIEMETPELTNTEAIFPRKRKRNR